MTAGLFIAAVLAVPLLYGLPVLRLASLAAFSSFARIAIAWACGNVLLTALLSVLAALGIPWNPWLVIAIAAIPVAVTLRMKAPRTPLGAATSRFNGSALVAVALGGVIAVAGLVQFAAGAATSADLSYFWGVKAVRFALDRGMDFQWMQLPHLIHLHPNYPPLWPVSLAWGAAVAGSLPWTAVPLLTWLYLIATGLIVHSLLHRVLETRSATVVSLLWLAVLTWSMVGSFSGGSAEGPLLLFVTVAVTALVVENRDEEPTFRWLAAGALAGAVLTKSEGGIAVCLVVLGTAIRDGAWRRPKVFRSISRLALPALAAALMWTVIRVAHGLPLIDPIRETAFHIEFVHFEVILKTCARLLGTGALWVGWLAPLLAVSVSRPTHPLRALPGLAVAAGLPLFAVFYYLHAVGDPVQLVVWTFPRLIQPALSVWIICLGVASFSAATGSTRVVEPPEGGN